MLPRSFKEAIQALYLELPALLVSIIVVEVFFKLRSFMLETLVFLVLWFGLRSLYLLGYQSITRTRQNVLPNFIGLAYLQLLPLVVSFLVAGAYFKFRSFLLEAAAFLALWLVLAIAYRFALTFLSKQTRLIPAPNDLLSR